MREKTTKVISHYFGVPLDAKLSDLLPKNAAIRLATIELSNEQFVVVTATYIPKEAAKQ